MDKKKIFLLGSLAALFIATFIFKDIDSFEIWIGSGLAYSLGVYWVYSFSFNNNMHILTMSTPLIYMKDDHKQFRLAVFCVAWFLILSILVGVTN
jgi:hypothetical protein